MVGLLYRHFAMESVPDPLTHMPPERWSRDFSEHGPKLINPPLSGVVNNHSPCMKLSADGFGFDLDMGVFVDGMRNDDSL